jgi:hypothetical protein
MNGSQSVKAGGWRRRGVIGTTVAVATVLILGSAAWACTQRVGTMVVCRPPARNYVSSAQCGKVTSTTQTGAPTVYKAGSTISVTATNFYAKRYAITFRKPGSTASCHAPGPNTVVLPNASTTFMGPSFSATVTTPSTGTVTGQAKICTEDVPDVITGQIINMTVI